MFSKDKRDALFYGLPCVYFRHKFFLFSPYLRKTLIINNIKNKEKLKLDIVKKFGENFFGKPYLRSKDKSYRKLTLITTTDCNLACRYCSVRGGEKKNFMPLYLAKKSVDEVIKQETKKVKAIFFGGEPTLNFNCIKEIVDYIKTKKVQYEFAISTNGIISKEIADFLCDNNFMVQISADGIPKIQNYQRPLPNGHPTSNLLEKTISYFVKRKTPFKIRETVTSLSVDKMAESVRYYAKLGVKYIFFEPLIPVGRALSHKKIKCPKPEEFIKEFERALITAEKEKIKIGNALLINLLHPSTHYCGAALGETLTITPTGLVTACTAIQDDCRNISKLMVVGEYKSGKFNYKSDRICNLRNYSVESIKKCSKCFAKYICSGGCIIRNLVKSGALEKTNDEYCKIRKGLLKLIILKMGGEKKIFNSPHI